MPHPPRPIRAFRLPAQRRPVSGRPRRRSPLDRELILHLGALPLLLPLLERLGLREVVNRHCHPREHPGGPRRGAGHRRAGAQPPAGAPAAGARGDLAGGTALPDLWGLEAPQCNDDRLARTLDALHPTWRPLAGPGGGRVQAFGLDLSRLAYDLTSVAFCGAYEGRTWCASGTAATTGRPQAGGAGDHGDPGGRGALDYRVLAGNVADRTTPVDNLRRLQTLLAALPPRAPTATPPLVVSDRAMLTLEALAAYEAAGCATWGRWTPPGRRGRAGAAGRRAGGGPGGPDTALAYRPQRAAATRLAPFPRGPTRLVLPHPEPARPPLRVRALVVWSPGKARVDAQVRGTWRAWRPPCASWRASWGAALHHRRRRREAGRHAAAPAPARAFVTVAVAPGETGPRAALAPPRTRWRRRPRSTGATCWAPTTRPSPRRPTGDQQAARRAGEALRPAQGPPGRAPGLPAPAGAHPQPGLLHHGRAAGLRPPWSGRPPRAGERDSGTVLLARFAELRVLVLSFRDGSRSAGSRG